MHEHADRDRTELPEPASAVGFIDRDLGEPTDRVQRYAEAVARVTPCSCSAQRARAEAAERALADKQAKVATFIGKRPEYVQALKSSPSADSDYWRWQGHAEARRQLCDNLGGPCRCGYHIDRITPAAKAGA